MDLFQLNRHNNLPFIIGSFYSSFTERLLLQVNLSILTSFLCQTSYINIHYRSLQTLIWPSLNHSWVYTRFQRVAVMLVSLKNCIKCIIFVLVTKSRWWLQILVTLKNIKWHRHQHQNTTKCVVANTVGTCSLQAVAFYVGDLPPASCDQHISSQSFVSNIRRQHLCYHLKFIQADGVRFKSLLKLFTHVRRDCMLILKILRCMQLIPNIQNHVKTTYDWVHDELLILCLNSNNETIWKMLLRYFIFFSSTWTLTINVPKSVARIDENCPCQKSLMWIGILVI